MSRLTSLLAFAGAIALASQLGAQNPGAPGTPPDGGPGRRQMRGPVFGRAPLAGPMRPGPDVAEQLLAHTGELKLSDQQVTRLAAIARRSADRRQAMRRSMDSVMTARAGMRPDSGRRMPPPPPEMRANAERARDQLHGDLRDALAVLSPDQLATAWELIGSRGPGSARRFGPM